MTQESTCEHAGKVRMDYRGGSICDEGGRSRIVNRICPKCGRHWFGPEGDVKEFTRAQWDAWINSPDDEIRPSDKSSTLDLFAETP